MYTSSLDILYVSDVVKALLERIKLILLLLISFLWRKLRRKLP